MDLSNVSETFGIFMSKLFPSVQCMANAFISTTPTSLTFAALITGLQAKNAFSAWGLFKIHYFTGIISPLLAENKGKKGILSKMRCTENCALCLPHQPLHRVHTFFSHLV